MMEVPSATEVTSPADDTVATAASEVVQVTVAPDMAVPWASLTVATMVAVSPIEVRVFEVGVTSTDAAAWLTVIALVAVTDPDVAVMVALPSATEVTSPADDTVATAASEVDQVIVCPLIVAEF
jgi:hypothetical protein